MPIIERRRILCVDDDQMNLSLMKEALEKEGYEVSASDSPRDAIEKISDWKPDLVVLDRNMPDINGMEVLRQLRLKKNYVSVIFVSGDTQAALIAESLLEGADDYLKKPFSFVELAARVKVRFRFKDIYEELNSAVAQLREQTERDFLTGLYNMRNMYEKIDYELKRTRRYGGRVGCIMMDMDHFKTVNDKHDHLFGSHVLKEVGKIIHDNIRDTDIAARYGGDEFLIVVIEQSEEGIKIMCDRLRKKFEETTFQSGIDNVRLTASLGYSISDPNVDIDARALVRKADHALYEAKAQGRNRVIGRL
jgi:two-component system, cell cycle response regulator